MLSGLESNIFQYGFQEEHKVRVDSIHLIYGPEGNS